MRAGKLRCSVVVQQRSTSQTSMLDQDTTWTDLFSTYADIESLSGRELMAAQAVQNEATHRIRMRYDVRLTAQMRIKFGTRLFNILTPARNSDMLSREMVFEAAEGVNDG